MVLQARRCNFRVPVPVLGRFPGSFANLRRGRGSGTRAMDIGTPFK